MLERVPLLDSQVIRALIVAGVGVVGIVCSFFGVDEALFNSEKVQRLADGVATLATLVGVVWAAWARTTKPTPPLTQAAEDATRTAVAAGDLKNGVGGKQAGFLRPLFGAFLVALSLVGLAVSSGCTGTRAAYESAETRPETRLEDYAYVVAEHYRALVHEAANLKESGRVPASLVERMQAADRTVKPIVLGDPQATPPRRGLRELAAAFRAARTAETEADLQRAVDAAVLALSDFIRAVETARGAQ